MPSSICPAEPEVATAGLEAQALRMESMADVPGFDLVETTSRQRIRNCNANGMEGKQ
jgi:hypothetical protein